MTEQEWLNCNDTTPMLEFLKGGASDRKLRHIMVHLAHELLAWHHAAATYDAVTGTWRLYLAFSEAAFAARTLGDAQITLSSPR